MRRAKSAAAEWIIKKKKAPNSKFFKLSKKKKEGIIKHFNRVYQTAMLDNFPSQVLNWINIIMKREI